MKIRYVAAITLAGMLTASVSLFAAAQSPATAPSETPPATAQKPGSGLVILDFKPAMDDLMTMLIQPRHLKLYYAGEAKNWKLAAFELNELRGALLRIGRTIPTYRGYSVESTVATMFSDPIKDVNTAIKAGDLAQFKTAYEGMTTACNACHTGMDHPFLVMKVPDAQIYPDQDFRP